MFAVNLKMVSTIQTAKFYVNLAVVTAKFCINLAVEEGKMRTFEFSLHFSSKAASLATSEKFLCFQTAVTNEEARIEMKLFLELVQPFNTFHLL